MIDVIYQYINNKEYPEAFSVFCEAAKTNDNLIKLVNIVNYVWDAGVAQQALNMALLLSEKFPSSSEVFDINNKILTETSHFDLLKIICQRYLQYREKDIFTLRRLSNCYFIEGDFDNCEATARKAFLIENNDSTRYNLGVALLYLGDYKNGFLYYESRVSLHHNLSKLSDEVFPFPRWQGEEINGKNILVWLEQGFGDVFQCLRFLPAIKNNGGKVTLLINKGYESLTSIIKANNLSDMVYNVNGNQIKLTKNYDYHCPIMSVFHCFSVTEKNIPCQSPYINIPTLHKSKNFLEKNTEKLQVGIVWSTELIENNNPLYNVVKNNKSISFDLVKPLFLIESISYINLKYPISTFEKETLKQKNVKDFSSDINDFGDTAAIINQLDLVVTIDTSVAHLAGAMGKPVILLLPYISDWRWQQNRDDSPWYPTMRLYRQVWKDDWVGVINRVKDTLIRVSQEYKESKAVNIFSN